MYLPGDQLHIPGGLTSVIGSGGKTSFLRYFSEALPGRIILMTSTHMFPFKDLPLVDTASEQDAGEKYLCADTGITAGIVSRLLSAFSKSRIIQVGSVSRQTEKMNLPAIAPSALLPLADHILVEADGSKRLPLKAHRSFEPVILPETALTVCLVGASGINRPVGEVCHCPDIFCRLADCHVSDPASPERIAAVLNKENLADLYLINQIDLLPNPETVLALCEHIKRPAAAGSLLNGRFL